MGYALTIDDNRFQTDDPVLTGRQLLQLVGLAPPEEHKVFFFGPGRQLEDIDLEETVDLREPGREHFITFRTDRTFDFELDGQKQPWGNEAISERILRWLSGVGDDYRVWQERRNEEDLLLEPGQRVSLETRGVERFYTGREDTNAGRAAMLPQMDQRYLGDRDMDPEPVTDGDKKGIVFPGFELPTGKFDHDLTDILIVLPASYPDAAPDMFFCFPWIKISGADGWPKAADQTFQFAGRGWQRWSRHNNEWRAGTDGIHTMLRRVNAALRDAS